mmetsp:Transcript_28180/g.71849  ORF Transcript_28180/g.71849 Transcript_28180/m.71849 type:complete len:430 (-) Transcript_28180:1114-2403(-)
MDFTASLLDSRHAQSVFFLEQFGDDVKHTEQFVTPPSEWYNLMQHVPISLLSSLFTWYTGRSLDASEQQRLSARAYMQTWEQHLAPFEIWYLQQWCSDGLKRLRKQEAEAKAQQMSVEEWTPYASHLHGTTFNCMLDGEWEDVEQICEHADAPHDMQGTTTTNEEEMLCPLYHPQAEALRVPAHVGSVMFLSKGAFASVERVRQCVTIDDLPLGYECVRRWMVDCDDPAHDRLFVTFHYLRCLAPADHPTPGVLIHSVGMFLPDMKQVVLRKHTVFSTAFVTAFQECLSLMSSSWDGGEPNVIGRLYRFVERENGLFAMGLGKEGDPHLREGLLACAQQQEQWGSVRGRDVDVRNRLFWFQHVSRLRDIVAQVGYVEQEPHLPGFTPALRPHAVWPATDSSSSAAVKGGASLLDVLQLHFPMWPLCTVQ